MHKLIIAFFVGLTLLSAANTIPGTAATDSASPPMGQDDNWVIVFHDNFEGNEIDPDNWTTCYWWDNHGCTNEGNSELQWYLPSNVFVRDGILVLQARKQPVRGSDGKVYEYTSGIVTTGRSRYQTSIPARFLFRYGYAEIRAKIPSGRGLWPAFWILPDTYQDDPEIDVMEVLGHQTDLLYTGVHYYDADQDPQEQVTGHFTPDLSQEWHVYGLAWQPDAITWYLDGVMVSRYTRMENLKPRNMYILLNLAVGGVWAGPPDDKTQFPAEFQIDYVSVWQRGSSN